MNAYTYVAYPKWVYHAAQPPRVVGDPSAHIALGPGWVESPRDVLLASERKEIEPVAAIVAPAAPLPGPTEPVPPVEIISEQAASDAEIARKWYALSAKDAVTKVTERVAIDELHRAREIEENKPGGPRRSVLIAISKRLIELQAAVVPA